MRNPLARDPFLPVKPAASEVLHMVAGTLSDAGPNGALVMLVSCEPAPSPPPMHLPVERGVMDVSCENL